MFTAIGLFWKGSAVNVSLFVYSMQCDLELFIKLQSKSNAGLYMGLLCVNLKHCTYVHCVCENPGAKAMSKNVQTKYLHACFVSVFDLVLGVSRAATARYIFIYMQLHPCCLYRKLTRKHVHVQCNAAHRRH